MKKLQLSLLAVACSLAITACSSSHNAKPEDKQQATSQLSQKPTQPTNSTKNPTAKAEEEKRLADEAAAKAKAEEEKRLADEAASKAKAEEEKRLADEAAVKAKAEEEKRLADEAAAKAKAEEEKRLADEAAEKAKAEEEKRLADEAAAKAKAEEEKRLAIEKEEKRLAEIPVELNKTYVDQGLRDDVISNVSGSLLTVNNGQVSGKNIEVSERNNQNELLVDGVRISLFSDELLKKHQAYGAEQLKEHNLTNADVIEGNLDGKTVSGKVGTLTERRASSDFNQVRYGVYSVDGVHTLFVQGHLTPTDPEQLIESPYNHYSYLSEPDATERLRAIPTSGSFIYNGNAFYGKDSYETLDSTAIADFDNKKVKVELGKNGENLLTFGGKIEGNTFAGKHNGIESKGAFYGSKARDIAGTFYHTEGNKKDYNGVFGASLKPSGSWYKPDGETESNALKDFELK